MNEKLSELLSEQIRKFTDKLRQEGVDSVSIDFLANTIGTRVAQLEAEDATLLSYETEVKEMAELMFQFTMRRLKKDNDPPEEAKLCDTPCSP